MHDLIGNESRWRQVNMTPNEEEESSEDKYITKKYLALPKNPKPKQFKTRLVYPSSIKLFDGYLIKLSIT